MDDNKEKNTSEQPKKVKFEPNSKYLTIMIYGLMFVTGSILIYKFIGNLSESWKMIQYMVSLVMPYLIGIFIALILYPPIHFLNKRVFTDLFHIKSKKVSKVLSIFVTYFIALGAFGILLGFVIPQLYNSVSDIVDQAPGWYDKTIRWINNYGESHPNSFIGSQEMKNRIDDAYPQIISALSGVLSNLLPYILNTSVAIIKGLVNFAIAIIVSIYMISDHKNIFYHFKRFLYAIMPAQTAHSTHVICKNCAKIFIDFLLGKALDSFIIGIICFIAMMLLKLPFALLISVIVCITNMVPYFGPYIGGVIGGAIIIIVNPVQVIIFAIMILILQQFDGLYLGPKILGESTGLKPLWVIFAITMGGYAFGVMGMFIGVPVVAVISYLLDISVQHLLDKKEIVVEPYESEDDI